MLVIDVQVGGDRVENVSRQESDKDEEEQAVVENRVGHSFSRGHGGLFLARFVQSLLLFLLLQVKGKVNTGYSDINGKYCANYLQKNMLTTEADLEIPREVLLTRPDRAVNNLKKKIF